MKFAVWEAIATRHAWYANVLETKMAEWPVERIYTCTDPADLQRAVKLAERVERHQQRTARHADRKRNTLKAAAIAAV